MSVLENTNTEVIDVARAVEKFYYKEARLLDDRLFTEWLTLWADDAHLWAPLRYNLSRREQQFEYSGEDDFGYFDDDKPNLEKRVRGLETGQAWAEDPPTRTRRLITNVEVEPDDSGVGDYRPGPHFLVYRNRMEADVDLHAGCRRDILRRTATDGLLIARREVILDNNVLLSRNLSIFF